MGDVPRRASGKALVAMVMLTQRQRQVAASGTQQSCPCAHSTLPNPLLAASTLEASSETGEGGGETQGAPDKFLHQPPSNHLLEGGQCCSHHIDLGARFSSLLLPIPSTFMEHLVYAHAILPVVPCWFIQQGIRGLG